MLEINYEGFDKSQTEAINYAYYSLGLLDDEMKCLLRKEYSSCIMWEIIEYFQENDDEGCVEEFKANYEPYLVQGNFSEDQISQIFDGLKNGLTLKEVELYAKNILNDLQMEVIKEALLSGLKIEDITFADSKMSPEEMEKELHKILDS